MTRIEPVSAHLVGASQAASVVGPAYDVLTPQQRRRISEENPLSFLRITRSASDLPPGTDPAAARLESAELLRTWIDDGVFEPARPTGFYLYRLSSDGHIQTGVVADLHVSDYKRGVVRRHENTREEKEAELVAFLRDVGVNSSPVCLTHRALGSVDAAVAAGAEELPLLEFETDDEVRHTIWRVDGATGDELVQAFSSIDALYLTDGHHRVAAAARFAAERPEAGRFLAVLFPADQLRILPYNRCVKVSRPDLIEVIGRHFEVESASTYEDARPRRRGEFGLYSKGRWWRLIRTELVQPIAKAADLDVSILHREVLGPLLESPNPDFDPRVSYVPGVGGPAALEQRCRAEGAAGVVLAPTSVEDVMAVSDAGEVMPPKSTWFDPKARSGIFVVYR
ncbi:MAG: DUF1015 domain-containing protein [Acidimicrobiia bacterium]